MVIKCGITTIIEGGIARSVPAIHSLVANWEATYDFDLDICYVNIFDEKTIEQLGGAIETTKEEFDFIQKTKHNKDKDKDNLVTPPEEPII